MEKLTFFGVAAFVDSVSFVTTLATGGGGSVAVFCCINETKIITNSKSSSEVNSTAVLLGLLYGFIICTQTTYNKFMFEMICLKWALSLMTLSIFGWKVLSMTIKIIEKTIPRIVVSIARTNALESEETSI